MKKTINRLIPPAAVSVVLFILTLTAASLLIRNLGAILYAVGEDQFGEIFSQIHDARLILPVWLPLALYALLGWGLWALFRKDKRRGLKLTVAILVCLVLLLLVTALTVLLTRVNGIRVLSVVRTLLVYFKNGIADQL